MFFTWPGIFGSILTQRRWFYAFKNKIFMFILQVTYSKNDTACLLYAAGPGIAVDAGWVEGGSSFAHKPLVFFTPIPAIHPQPDHTPGSPTFHKPAWPGSVACTQTVSRQVIKIDDRLRADSHIRCSAPGMINNLQKRTFPADSGHKDLRYG
jgi:hypothetical protein